MEETDLVTEATPLFRAIVPGLLPALGTLVSSGQDRKNLEADLAAVHSLFQSGKTDIRYDGVVLKLETFADKGQEDVTRLVETHRDEVARLVEAHQEEVARLVTNTVNIVSKAEAVVDWSKVNLAHFDPEFRRRWITEASNVSDETLQGLWARLLAGELESPGSVSNDTLTIARDLTRERAEEFQILCSAALYDPDDGAPLIVVGCGRPAENSLRPYGLSYDVLMRLAHHRLIVSDMTSLIDLPLCPSQPMITVRQQEMSWILRSSDDNKQTESVHRIEGILFTTAGKELFAIVEKIPNPAYTTAMSKHLERRGWTAVPVSNRS